MDHGIDDAWEAISLIADTQPGDPHDGNYYFRIIREDYDKIKEKIAAIRMFVGEGQWIPCSRCCPAAEVITSMCDK